MKKEKTAAVKKVRKNYEKPRLTRYQKLTSIIAGNGTGGALGCTRF